MNLKEKSVRWFVSVSLIFSFTYFIFLDSLQKDNFASFGLATSKDHRRGGSINPVDQQASEKLDRLLWAYFPLYHHARWIRTYYILIAVIFFILLTNNFLLCLLDLDSFKEYRYLDCLILGRVTIDGKYASAAKYAVVVLGLFQFSWLIIMVYMKPCFNLTCLNFLLHNKEVIAKRENELLRHKSASKSTYSDCNLTSTTIQSTAGIDMELNNDLLSVSFQPNLTEMSAPNNLSSLITDDPNRSLYKSNKIPPELCHNHHHDQTSFEHRRFLLYILRPTRKMSSWHRLVNITWIYQLIFVVILSLLVPLAIAIVVPMLVTQRGFRLNYANCIDYLARRPHLYIEHYEFLHLGDMVRSTMSNISSITEPQRVSILPLVDIRRISSFELLRVTLDAASSFIFWGLSFSALISDTYIAVLIAADSGAYTKVISACVTKLLGEIRRSNLGLTINTVRPRFELELADNEESAGSLKLATRRPMCTRSYEPVPTRTLNLADNQRTWAEKDVRQPKRNLDDQRIFEDAITLQTMMVDFFKTTAHHNTYVSFYVIYCILLWLSSSFVNVLFITNLTIRGLMSRRDIYLIQALCTIYFVIICSLFASARHLIFSTYTRLATIMALDNSSEASKNRWSSLMRYYYPMPLYCFSIFRTTEISWLLGVKIIAWIMSAFFVVLSFQRASFEPFI